MLHARLVALVAVMGVALAAAAHALPIREDWHDPSRGRRVPVKIYEPAAGSPIAPVVIFSHGMGGNREAMTYLGEALSAAGYLVVSVQHTDSDESVWKDLPLVARYQALRKVANDPAPALNRPRDVAFALDKITELAADGQRWAGRVDPNRAAIVGHSFGAWTALVVAGRRAGASPMTPGIRAADPRFDAAVAFSSPSKGLAAEAMQYDEYRLPTLHMTGTKDESPLGETGARYRRVPFDAIRGQDQALVTFNGGDHMIFAQGDMDGDEAAAAIDPSKRLIGFQGDRKLDPQFREQITAGTLAFLDWKLRGDAERGEWLTKGGYAGQLGKLGTLETKGALD